MVQIPGIESVHELHVWRLDQRKSIASAHVVVSNNEMIDFMDQAKIVKECLHAYGIHSATLQPELSTSAHQTPHVSGAPGTPIDALSIRSASVAANDSDTAPVSAPASLRRRRNNGTGCQIVCGNLCESLTCCNTTGALRI